MCIRLTTFSSQVWSRAPGDIWLTPGMVFFFKENFADPHFDYDIKSVPNARGWSSSLRGFLAPWLFLQCYRSGQVSETNAGEIGSSWRRNCPSLGYHRLVAHLLAKLLPCSVPTLSLWFSLQKLQETPFSPKLSSHAVPPLHNPCP